MEAPFEMPAINVPNFSNARRFPITDFGAVSGDKEKISKAIEKAIKKANKVGGGVVVIPEGEWLTGKVHLKSNVNLHLNKGQFFYFQKTLRTTCRRFILPGKEWNATTTLP